MNNFSRYITTKNVLIATIVVLVLLNIATISALWHIVLHSNSEFNQTSNINDLKNKDRTNNMRQFLIEELHLDPKQAQLVDELKQIHMQETREYRQQIRDFRQQIYEENFSPDRSDEKIDELLLKLNKAQLNLEKAHIAHIEDMKTIVSPEQMQNLKRLFIDISQHNFERHNRRREPKRGR